jgi:hypothetical protein
LVNWFIFKVGESIVVDVTATENLNGALTFEVGFLYDSRFYSFGKNKDIGKLPFT